MYRNPTLRIVVGCLVLLSLVTLSACSSTQSAGTQIDDATIVTKIKAKLTADTEINQFNIDVDSNGGEVTLQGTVAKDSARSGAERHARDTEGVKRVINLIKVEPQG
jgi:osmotically-inducible protein OsmY